MKAMELSARSPLSLKRTLLFWLSAFAVISAAALRPAFAQDRQDFVSQGVTCFIVFDSEGGSVFESRIYNNRQWQMNLDGMIRCTRSPVAGLENYVRTRITLLDYDNSANANFGETLAQVQDRRELLKRCAGMAQLAMSNPVKYQLRVGGSNLNGYALSRPTSLTLTTSTPGASLACGLERNLTEYQ